MCSGMAGMTLSSGSDRDELTVLAPGHPQAVRDLPDRRPGPNGAEDGRHEVAVSPRDPFELVHRGGPVALRTLGSGPLDTLDLASGAGRVDRVDRRGRDDVVPEAVDPDDDLLARVHRQLHPISRLLDLALLEPSFDGAQRPA